MCLTLKLVLGSSQPAYPLVAGGQDGVAPTGCRDYQSVLLPHQLQHSPPLIMPERALELAQSLKCFSCMRTHIKMGGMVVCACNPSAGEVV